MIAICPSCHDAVDRGRLHISDDDLYRWKGIDRSDSLATAHIFIEPGEAPRLLLGSFTVEGESGLVVFDFAERHRLSFALRDGDIMLLNLKISDPEGRLLIDVVDGYVRQRDPNVDFRTRPGAIRVPAGLDSPFIPCWVRSTLVNENPRWLAESLPLLALNVIDRGLVRVQGMWFDSDRGVIITPELFSFVSRAGSRSLAGSGEQTRIHYVGPLGASMFEI
jgi:hypothetical protein